MHENINHPDAGDDITAARSSYMQYLDALTGGMNPREIAKVTGVPYSNIYRLTTSAKSLDVKIVVEICRAFDAPLLPAFVAAHFITEDEARSAMGSKGLDLATDKELAAEAVRRMGQGRQLRSVLDEPLGKVVPLRGIRGHLTYDANEYWEEAQ